MKDIIAITDPKQLIEFCPGFGIPPDFYRRRNYKRGGTGAENT